MLQAQLVRHTRGWTPETIDALPVHDFWVWIMAFGRIEEARAEAERKAMEAQGHGRF